MVEWRGVDGVCHVPISAWRPLPAPGRSHRLWRLKDLLHERRVEIFGQGLELVVCHLHDIAVGIAIKLARFRDDIALALNDDDIAVAEDSIGSICIGPGELPEERGEKFPPHRLLAAVGPRPRGSSLDGPSKIVRHGVDERLSVARANSSKIAATISLLDSVVIGRAPCSPPIQVRPSTGL